jgi:hypothetical protein
MERSIFKAALVVAFCLFVLGVALYSLSSGVIPSATSILAAIASASLLAGVCLLAFTGVLLWLSVGGERVTYRVFYHAEQPPDGETIGRALQSIARNAGHVTIVWQIRCAAPHAGSIIEENVASSEPGVPANLVHESVVRAATNNSPLNVALYIVAPSSARLALEGVLSNLLPGVWAERCREPVMHEHGMPGSRMKGWLVHTWRWVADDAQSGGIADPLSCGIHLRELEQGIKARAGLDNRVTDVRAIEVRLTLWPRGVSTVVTAVRAVTEATEATTITEATEATAQIEHTPPAPKELSPETAQSSTIPQGTDLPFLKPLLWERLSNIVLRPGARRTYNMGDLSGQANFDPVGFESFVVRRSHSAAKIRTIMLCELKLARNFPIWERVGARTNSERARNANSGKVAVAQTVAGRRIGPYNRNADFCIRLPATRADYASLDSIEVGELAPHLVYSLPPVTSQVLVLGVATHDGRPVGVPAIRRSPRSSHSSHSFRWSHSSQVPSDKAKLSAADPNKTVPVLHPMLAEHLLVAGGTERWRRDVAGSVVSQALEMGITVVVVDGGSPPDEPPATAANRARLKSADMRQGISGSSSSIQRPTSPTSTGSADPLSPAMLRPGDTVADRGVVQIDLDNPAGSVRPNMLFVQAPRSLPLVQGESLALSLALGPGLRAQMSYLQAVNVIGMDAGIANASLPDPLADGTRAVTPEEAIIEAWLTVLLLRHHRARLLLAVRGGERRARPARSEGLHSRQNRQDRQQLVSPFSADCHIPACPDLPTLMLVLEEPETLRGLLRRAREAWGDPDLLSVIRDMGDHEGESAVRSAQEALEHVSSIERLDLSDQYLYGATLRGQLQRLLGHPAISRMLRGPHISLADLLDDGMTRLLKVNLSGAYETVALPYSDDDMARKQYGLYLLWSLLAASRQRVTLSEQVSERQPDGPALWRAPRPLLLMLHGAGSWFGSGSPLSDSSVLAELGSEASGIAVAATVSGLRHLRSYRDGAGEVFGNLVLGPVPVVDLDAPQVILNLVDTEIGLLRDGMQSLHASGERKTAAACVLSVTSPVNPGEQVLHGDRLLEVIRRINEGTALVVTGMPGGRKSVCTARVSSVVAGAVREQWVSSAPPFIGDQSGKTADRV